MIGDLRRVWEFVNAFTGVAMTSDMKVIGLERDGELIAGVLFENFNGRNCWMHVAVAPGEYVTRAFTRYSFEYPFRELGLQRLTGWVEASNTAARDFDERLGFEVEAVLNSAASDGGPALIYCMRRENCRWIKRDPSMAASGLS